MQDPAVTAYIAAAGRRERLETLRALIHAAVPDVAESIEWQMPVFRRGAHWVAMADRAAYLSVYLQDAPLVDAIAAGDPRLKRGKACLNIPDRADLPLAGLEAAFRQLLGA